MSQLGITRRESGIVRTGSEAHSTTRGRSPALRLLPWQTAEDHAVRKLRATTTHMARNDSG